MRPLVLLALIVLSFVLILTYYPSSAVEGAGEAPAATEEVPAGARGTAPAREPRLEPQRPDGLQPGVGGFALTRPDERPAEASPRASAAAPRESEAVLAVPLPAPEEPEPEPRQEDWLGGLELAPQAGPYEAELAAALWHQGHERVRAVLAARPEIDRAPGLLAEAFALALEGRPRDALERAERLDEEVLGPREKELLRAALQGQAPAPVALEASVARRPLQLAMELCLRAREGVAAFERGDALGAVRALSDVLLAELEAPWPADPATLARWTEPLHQAQEQYRWNPKGAWAGVEMVVEEGDSAVALRKRFLRAHPSAVMCTGLILRSNRVRGYLQPNQRLRIPTDRPSILVDLSARWSLYLMGREVVGSWPVGIGRPGQETPPGTYVAGDKLENPSWMRPGHETIPFGDERNPLGTRWIGWELGGANTSYGLHGTWEPSTIGKPSSDGCIRYLNEDVEEIFDILPAGAPIIVRA